MRRTRRRFTTLTALVLLLCTPMSAFAHRMGLSTVEFLVEDTSVEVLLTCDLTHLDAAAGLDKNLDRGVDEDELMAGEKALLKYFDDRMSVFGGEHKCEASLRDLVYDGPRTAGIITLRFECGVPLGTVEVINHAFTEQPGNHQFLGVIKEDDRRFRVSFNRQQRKVRYEATPPEAREIVEQTDEHLEAESLWGTIKSFVSLGVEHILLGFDHILFVFALLIAARRMKSVLYLITSFTLAHSVTLALAALDVVSLSSGVVEPLIAASILVVAVENILREGARIEGFRPKILAPESRFAPVLVFFFGLIHGFGFAGILRDLGLPQERLLTSLVSFNVGVELGQLGVVLVSWTVLVRLMKRHWYPRLVQAMSVVIGMVALWWLVERLGE